MKTPTAGRYFPLLAASIMVMLIWLLSFADPCLMAALRGGPPASANAIAITGCVIDDGRVSITKGDALLRMLALAAIMGLFGLVGGLLDPARRKRSFAGIAAVGATCGFAIYMTVQFVMPYGAIASTFHLVTWALCVMVSALASALGAAIGSDDAGPPAG